MIELYSFINKLIEKNGPIQPNQNIIAEKLKNIKDIEEFQQNLKSGEHYGLPAEFVIKLIAAFELNSQFSTKENKYRDAIKGLERELKEKSLNIPEKSEIARIRPNTAQKEQYMQRIRELEKQLSEKEELFNITNKKNGDDNELRVKIKDINEIVKTLKTENESLNIKYKQIEVKYSQLESKYKEKPIK